MTVRTVIATPVAPAEAAGLAQIARIKGLAKLRHSTNSEIAKFFPCSERVKSAVTAINLTDSTLVDAQVIVGAFLQGLRNRSVFYTLLEDGMVRLPFQHRVSMLAADVTAWVIGEGKPIPLTRGTLSNAVVGPRLAAALLVTTEQLLANSRAEQNLTAALRRGITAVVDASFFDSIIDSSTVSVSSAGADAADAVEDIAALLEAVEPTVESRLLFAMDPALMRRAATLTNSFGAFQFPDLTPTGGTIVGVPAIPSDGVGEGTVALIDATGIAGDSGLIDIDVSNQADIEMLNAALQQDALASAQTTLVSMFQTNSVAIRTTAEFGAERLRDNAIALLTEAAWGSFGSGA
jgi:hypothetical protein